MRKNILITGIPRSGKSTLLNKIIQNYTKKAGFVTNELRENGERVGFEIETSAGKKTVLASVKFNTDFKVSKYFVEIKNLESIIPEITNFKSDDLLYIDEIALMELPSEKFRQLVLKYLKSKNTCIATIHKEDTDDFSEEIKERDDIILIEITEENREQKQVFIGALLKKIEKARLYSSQPERFSIKSNKATLKSEHNIRHLVNKNKSWTCDCDFFKENQICSHVLAIEEVLRTK